MSARPIDITKIRIIFETTKLFSNFFLNLFSLKIWRIGKLSLSLYCLIKTTKTMAKVNLEKHIWEGWTVGAFINDLEPIFNMIMRGQSWQKPFKTKEEVKKWCIDNQSGYKKHIPDVVNYFVAKLPK